MDEKFKRLAWISSGGLAIGVLVRRASDSARGIPDLNDSVLADPTALIFGISFVGLWLLLILTVYAFESHKPFAEARDYYARTEIRRGKVRRIALTILRSCRIAAERLWIYFFIALFGFRVLTGDPIEALKLFGYWCLALMAGWFGWRDSKAGISTVEPETLHRNAVKVLGLPEIEGGFAVIVLAVAMSFAYLQYDKVSQSFGGGKPEDAVLFLKQAPSTSDNLKLDGKLVQILFRRGSKIGIRTSQMKGDQFLVLDLSQIDHLYVGTGVRGAHWPKP